MTGAVGNYIVPILVVIIAFMVGLFCSQLHSLLKKTVYYDAELDKIVTPDEETGEELVGYSQEIIKEFLENVLGWFGIEDIKEEDIHISRLMCKTMVRIEYEDFTIKAAFDWVRNNVKYSLFYIELTKNISCSKQKCFKFRGNLIPKNDMFMFTKKFQNKAYKISYRSCEEVMGAVVDEANSLVKTLSQDEAKEVLFNCAIKCVELMDSDRHLLKNREFVGTLIGFYGYIMKTYGQEFVDYLNTQLDNEDHD